MYGSFPASVHLSGQFILHVPVFIKVIYAECLSREPVIDNSVWKIAIFQPHQNKFPTNVAVLDIGYEISKYHAEVTATEFQSKVFCIDFMAWKRSHQPQQSQCCPQRLESNL